MFCRAQGFSPVAISMTVQPSDQMSALQSEPFCLIISGAIQGTVPFNDSYMSLQDMLFSMVLDHPKSEILTSPFEQSNTLAHFRS
jgi:hypothetical protein